MGTSTIIVQRILKLGETCATRNCVSGIDLTRGLVVVGRTCVVL